MLSLLRIKNFALIDQLELEFEGGLNVLTGETGAGKSIILDAIDLALGGKVSIRSLRQGTTRGMIEATFVGNRGLELWLKEQEIELLEDGSLVCSRELTLTGENMRSRSRINGILVNRQSLGQLRDRLVEITAQGQTVQLMIPTQQRELLDLYGGELILTKRHLVAKSYEELQAVRKALESRRQSEQQRLQKLSWLEFQTAEINAAKLEDPTELEQLEQESDRLAHVVDLQQLSYQVYQLLYQNDREASAAADLLGQAESILDNMVSYDRELEGILEIVRNALNQVVEAGNQLNHYGDSLEADPQRLAEVEERIRFLKQICRKYGPSLNDAIAYYEKLQGELQELNEHTQSIEELEKQYQQNQEKLTHLCQNLTQLRKQAALTLEQQLIEELKPLAMEKVRFECKITPTDPSSNGADQVVYYFSPNEGEDIQPLASSASGGEMSRFLLALKACFSQLEKGVNTLIFDEIDAGVSGKVAQSIAAKLHQLGQNHQILCVTHQPLIAAMADVHFRVEKETIQEDNSNDIRTVIRVNQLKNHHTRREELAQLTGGHSASDAIAFAESLLTQAAAKRKTRK